MTYIYKWSPTSLKLIQFQVIIVYFQQYQSFIKYIGKILKKSGAFYQSSIQMQINGNAIAYLSILFILRRVFDRFPVQIRFYSFTCS